jgi:methionine sulfoxide reductase heme-binding subunit
VGTTTGPSALWYLTRGTGTVTLVLLTLSLALGIANVRRVRTDTVPRFVFDAVHRSVSLLALAFLAVHIATSVLDPFAPIRLLDAVVPFVSSYRPIWLGLGAVASDVLIALVVTSLLRRRFGYRTWRVTHWLAYACWPIALVHGLGTGSDARTNWMLLLTAGCVLVVLVAVWIRAAAGWPDHSGIRASAVLASIAAPLALVVWLPNGPLAAGWSKRAGTPPSLLVKTSPAASSSASSGASTSGAGSSASGASSSGGGSSTGPSAFNAQVSGTVNQSHLSRGLVQVDVKLTVAGQPLRALDIRIDGQPLSGGGVAMSSSRVTLGTGASASLYRGRITGLEGTNIAARVSSAHGSLALVAQLQIDPRSGVVTGALAARPGEGTEGGP